MGKAANWFRSLLSSKKPPKDHRTPTNRPFSNSSSTSIKFSKSAPDPLASPYADGLDANKHAIAVAAATAAVAEAALAAAQAAAEVVRLTSSGGSARSAADLRPVAAAIRIQSAFRAYLARRALRALKGLVKLQALVRGHIVRKQSADMLRRMQAMARIQARASANRCYTTDYTYPRMKFNNSHHPQGNTNIRKNDGRSHNVKRGGSHLKQNHLRSPMDNGLSKGGSQPASRWLNHWIDDYTWNNNVTDACLENGIADDGRSDKILEIDTWKPRQSTNRSSKAAPVSQYFSAWNDRNYRLSSKPNPSISSEEVSSIISSKVPPEGDQFPAWTADNSPRVHSASSRPGSNLRGAFSPARSECSRSFYGDYLGHPSYMANTESSRAKARSLSAPKQRMSIEDLKFSPSIWELDAVSEKVSVLSSNQRSNGYLYNGQLKRQGTPSRHDLASGYGSLFSHRH